MERISLNIYTRTVVRMNPAKLLAFSQKQRPGCGGGEMPGSWSCNFKQPQNFRELLARISRVCINKKIHQCIDQIKEISEQPLSFTVLIKMTLHLLQAYRDYSGFRDPVNKLYLRKETCTSSTKKHQTYSVQRSSRHLIQRNDLLLP